MAPSATTSVQVALRIRPTTNQDAISIPARFQRTVIHATSSNSVSVDSSNSVPAGAGGAQAQQPPATAPPGKKQTFNFDIVLPQSTTQHALYTATARPLIERFVEGFNCTILAYGQTSSGKTYSMTGVDLDGDPSDPGNGMGIIPRSIAEIFARAKALKDQRGSAWNWSIKGSFIEIYNEDLIDLLVGDGGGARREVQIREDKEGNIIWGGLREVEVRSVREVMNLIRAGTSLRRTNETDMNAQSSRSHAIFSLTLTQRKFTGSGNPARSMSPGPVGQSRIARPGSVSVQNGRVASPTFGRPQTPSFATAMGRGGARPGSSLGLHRPGTPEDDAPGEWTTIVSKFHFVDLAGSERLKRTAAAGERAKEGISINGGLLALGNVISALGDPKKGITHVPYRDSKLTRLLQDSLGGNAHTLMIACVSPAEWNAAETVNTLKYANRARNIKNKAEIREKEEGWDDMEWLQNMVTRLRKEVKTLKEGGSLPSDNSAAISEKDGAASKKVVAQYVELQENYQELRERFVERTEELTRLRREHGEMHRNSGGANGGMGKYEEIVGPVIEEYEKTISAIEAELKLNRAALRLTNELVSEKEEELTTLTDRHAKTESYVEELRSRIARLSEREASTESYIHDLEDKIRTVDDSTHTSSSTVSELKKEIARHKESEAHSAQYIVELEARLSRSDESVLQLRATVEALERDAETRRNEVEVLQARLEALKADGDGWRSELEARERKVVELEQQLLSWEERRREAGIDRERLGDLMNGVEKAKTELEDNIARVREVSSHEDSGPQSAALQEQLVSLQQTHTATLADLSAVSAKYRDALREISDLAEQIAAAKLTEASPDGDIHDSADDRSPRPRRGTFSAGRAKEVGEGNTTPRRRFFRHAASTESLHARSQSQSQSLSQELSSARSSRPSMGRSLTSPNSSTDLRSTPSRTTSPTLLLPPVPTSLLINHSERSVESLEKEIMRLQEVLKEREAEISVLEDNLRSKDATPPRPVTPDELGLITDAALSPSTVSRFNEIRKAVSPHEDGVELPEASESLGRLDELMRSMAQKESTHREVVDDLNAQLRVIRRQHDELTALSRDQALNMSNELEGLRDQLRASVDKCAVISANVMNLKNHEADLVTEQEVMKKNFIADIDRMRRDNQAEMQAKASEIESLLARTRENEMQLTQFRDQLADASAALRKTQEDHEAALNKLRGDNEADVQRRLDEAHQLLSRTKDEHELKTATLIADHVRTLERRETDFRESSARLQSSHEEALRKLVGEHSDAISRLEADNASKLERLGNEHLAELQRLESAREGLLSDSHDSQLQAMRQLEDAHATAIREKTEAFTKDVEKLKAEHARVLTLKAEDQSSTVQQLEKEHAVFMAQAEAKRVEDVQRLESVLESTRAEQSVALAKLKSESEEMLLDAKRQHASILESVAQEHEASTAALRLEHSSALASLKIVHEQAITTLDERRTKELEELRTLHHAAIEELTTRIADEKLAHEKAWATKKNELLENHSIDVENIFTKHQNNTAFLKQQHAQELLSLKSEHTSAISAVQDALNAAEARHVAALDEARTAADQVLSEERDHQVEMLTELDVIHSRERDALKKDIESFQQENLKLKEQLADVKALADSTTSAHGEQLAMQDALLREKSSRVTTVESELASIREEHATFATEISRLTKELELSRSQQTAHDALTQAHDALTQEAQSLRAELSDVRSEQQRFKDEIESLRDEKARQDSFIKDLQAQIATQASSRASPTIEARSANFSRINQSASRLPPATPPPSVPPPPVPSDLPPLPVGDRSTTHSTATRSSESSRGSIPDSPGATSATSLPSTIIGNGDARLLAQLEEKDQTIEEQETMIRTLNKQLSHCEGDLQAHMDLVSNLETKLGDADRNHRKARMQATELAKERDTLKTQVDTLRVEVVEAKNELASMRRSVTEEKLTLENRLDEERRAKERARAQLDSRMEELQRRKSKFICM